MPATPQSGPAGAGSTGLGVVIATIAVSLALVLNPNPDQLAAPVLLALVVAMFALATESPAWVVGPLLVVEFTMPNYIVSFTSGFGVSNRLLCSIAAVVLIAPLIRAELATSI